MWSSFRNMPYFFTVVSMKTCEIKTCCVTLAKLQGDMSINYKRVQEVLPKSVLESPDEESMKENVG